ncbi:hypothetical protein [Catellatospora vulcania]|uniref:hypothetical protein n=1 Tax=Catellatospora vulcania TaxID=1460450 RepID=UPI0012D426EC|nr:hypothetical protein [Catellatospora vulcania]
MPRKTVEVVARDLRLAAAARTDLGKVLSAKDVRKAADADKDLSAHLAEVNDVLTEQAKAAASWQKALTEAHKRWDASLDKLSRLHPGPTI